VAFVLGCAVTIGGLADDRDWGDVGHYRYIADRVADGEIPYHDYYVEYPPAALAAFLVVQPFDDYAFAFKLAMVVLGLATLAVAMIALRLLEAPSRIPALLVVFAAAPIALGHLLLNRYDLWPALLATGALTAILADRSPWQGVSPAPPSPQRSSQPQPSPWRPSASRGPAGAVRSCRPPQASQSSW